MPLLSDFLERYRAKTTRAMYVSAWVKFLSLLYGARLGGASPETLDPWVAKYVNDLRNGRRNLASDLRALGEVCRTRKTGLGYQSAVRTLLAGIDPPLLPTGKARVPPLPGPPPSRAQQDPLTPGMVLRILEHLDTRGRAILFVLASSGARLGEVLAIRLSDLDLDSRPARFRIRDPEGGVARVAFISREAAGAIRVYLIVRDRFLSAARSRGGKAAEDLLFPLGGRTFGAIWALALAKARLERFDPVTGRRTTTPGAARRFFAARMGEVLPVPLLRELMGDTGHRPGQPPRYTDEELGEAYLQAEQAVTLHRSHRKEAVARKIAELEREVAGLRERVGEREEELARIRESLSLG